MAVHLAKPSELPEGLSYRAEFLSREEEQELLRRMGELPFQPFEFQGYTAKRRIVEYGFEYDFSSRQASAAMPIPEFLQALSGRVAAWAGLPGKAIREAVVTEYPPGAPIGWHRDVPQFEVVLGISLASACRMRFRPYAGNGDAVFLMLEPRSIYAMRGAARWEYQHSIPAVKELRYSITFRTLREKKSWPRRASSKGVESVQ